MKHASAKKRGGRGRKGRVMMCIRSRGPKKPQPYVKKHSHPSWRIIPSDAKERKDNMSLFVSPVPPCECITRPETSVATNRCFL
ncbi:hypothetical protein OUZ56_002049 [Daphnia magna]|uniref:Uncharacterized protein n=1 Tax=Daphnia magna TaxID=35525 RepID=A0ABR0A4J4_9CRUS|nr:hypothetical protein OUZ56_002049 [Daphnia magna]